MRIVIAGPGALGLFFAGKLCEHNEVTLLHHDKAAADLLARKGFSVSDEITSHHLLECGVSVPQTADLLLIAFKTRAWPEAEEEIRKCDAKTVLTVQNGIGNMERLAQLFDERAVCAASVTYGVTRESALSVRIMGHGTLEVGALEDEQRAKNIVNLLSQCGLNSRHTTDISRTVWLKAGVNMCINPVACMYDVTNGELLDIPRITELWTDIAAEVSAAAQLDDVRLEPSELVKTAREVATRTSSNVCSMLQDIRAGRLTEIESLCGEVIRRSKEAGLSTDTCECLYQSIKMLESAEGIRT